MQAPAARPHHPLDMQMNPWPIRLVVLAIWAAGLMAVAVITLALVGTRLYDGKILPGVSALGIPLGGLTEQEAADAMRAALSSAVQPAYTLTYDDRTWEVTADELGIAVDVERAAADAARAGRADGLVNGAVAQALTWLNGEQVTPGISYDQAAAVAVLTAISADVNQAGAGGGLTVTGTTVQAAPAQTARVLDIAASLQAVDAAIASGGGGPIALVVHDVSGEVAGLDEAAAALNTALAAPITVTAEDAFGNPLGPWTITPEQIAQILDVRMVSGLDGQVSYAVDADFSPFAAYLESLADGLISSPVDGRFHFNEATRELEMIQPAVGGRRLDVQATFDELRRVVFLPADQRTARMQFTYIQPTYHNNIRAADLGIVEKVAEAVTSFAGSDPNRRINIALATSKMDGVIIGPGEEFSFNRLLGDLEPEEGWVESHVIFADRTGTGLGGGVCQVSTTIFRAAFSGGFTIIERHPHGYRVGFYEQGGFPPGLDAAIFTPERDFRFQNDTPYHLLIEASVYPGADQLAFRFYSTNTGRIVEIETPRVANRIPPETPRFEANASLAAGEVLQVDWAAEGADVNVGRIVRDANGSIIRQDNIFTHYLPWGAIYQVNPNDPRLNQ